MMDDYTIDERNREALESHDRAAEQGPPDDGDEDDGEQDGPLPAHLRPSWWDTAGRWGS